MSAPDSKTLEEILSNSTPAPWHAGHLADDDCNCNCASVFDEGRYMGGIGEAFIHNGIDSISEGGNDCPPREEAIANLRLFAASPELAAELVYSRARNAELQGALSKAEVEARGLRNERDALRAAFVCASDELGNTADYCLGCGHVAGDHIVDLEIIRKAGGISCCPERKMVSMAGLVLSHLPELQPDAALAGSKP